MPCQTIRNSTCSNKKADMVVRNTPNSNEVGVGKNHKSKVAMHGIAEKVQPRTAAKPCSMQCSLMEIGDHVEMDVNQVTQSAPDSPPFCDTKGSDNNCSDQVSGQVELFFSSLNFYLVKSSFKIGRLNPLSI